MRTVTRAAATALAGPLAFTAAGGTMAVTADSASAAITGDYLVSGANIRAAATLSSTVVGVGYPGQGVTSWCWKYGDQVGGGSNAWDYHTNLTTRVNGYSSVTVLTFSSRAGLPQC
jgi:hypothetical protein